MTAPRLTSPARTSPHETEPASRRRLDLTRLVLALVLALTTGAGVMLVAAVEPALAHTALLSSSPADGARVSTAPSRVTLTFTEDIRPQFVVVQVTGPRGTSVARGAATADGGTVTQALGPQRPAGEYAVVYRVVSADGHPVSGTLRFRARSAVGAVTSTTSAGGTTSPEATTSGTRSAATPTPTGSTSSTAVGRPSGPETERVGFWDASHLWGFVAVGALLLGGVAIALYQRRRRL